MNVINNAVLTDSETTLKDMCNGITAICEEMEKCAPSQIQLQAIRAISANAKLLNLSDN